MKLISPLVSTIAADLLERVDLLDARLGGDLLHRDPLSTQVVVDRASATSSGRRSPSSRPLHSPRAPVAQGIERCPAEAEVACSNHAGRTSYIGAAPVKPTVERADG
jgi:hypothetical protein